jgi:hypothetical protein
MTTTPALADIRRSLATMPAPGIWTRLRRALPAATVSAMVMGLAMALAAVTALSLHGYALATTRTPILAAIAGLSVVPPFLVLFLIGHALPARAGRLWPALAMLVLAVPVTLAMPALGYALVFREIDGGDAALFTRPWLHDQVWSTLAALYLFVAPARAFIFPALPAVPLLATLLIWRARSD